MVEENILLARKYFEWYCEFKDIEPDTIDCDTLIDIMWDLVNWDSDKEDFYNFMVENMV